MTLAGGTPFSSWRAGIPQVFFVEWRKPRYSFPVHVALDASDLATDRLDGTTVYARELLPRLTSELLLRGATVTAFAPAPLPDLFPASDALRIIVLPRRRFWTQTRLSRALFHITPDLLFLPIQTVPLYRPRTLKVVATVHDLDFFDHPHAYTLENRLLLRWFTRVVARNAMHLVAVSETTKRAILRHYRRDPSDITVIYHGVDSRTFFPPTEGERAAASARVQREYGIPPRPIVFVGALQPRKNVSGLVAAFERMRREGREEHLVIVTGNAWKEEDILAGIERSPARSAIHILPNVPRADLAPLYWNAGVFVLPSFAEGFGLPIVEAMACGTPVVTSNVSALAEIAADGAVTVDPRDAGAIATAVIALLTDPARRDAIIERGRLRAAEFSWEATAAKTADVIERLLHTV